MYIDINNLNFSYPNSDKKILDDFTLQIKKGAKVCILGESGSGKSTVLRLIAGLERQSSGRIEINGKVFSDNRVFISPEKRGIGMVFQDYALFPHMTVEKNITFGLSGKSKEEKRELLDEMLNIIHMKDYEHRHPYELSGGQQQRIAIARSLILKPSVLLLDEPLSNLDSSLKKKIRADLKEIIEQAHITTLLVTHDKNDCISICDYVFILKNGKIVQSGLIDDVIHNPADDYVRSIFK